jgi:hypothetical protein
MTGQRGLAGRGSSTLGDVFPNMVRDREQLSRLWIHIAELLSDNVRQKAMGEGEPQEGLPRIGGGVQDSWQRRMEAEGGMRGEPSDFELESRMSQGELGAAERAFGVPQLADPATRSSEALPASEIARVAFEAGFRGEALATMVAIALSESTGNPMAHNPVGKDDSYGLWQINMLGDMGPQRRRMWGLQSNEDLWDPATNARAAYSLVQGRRGGFQDWSDYNNGRYLRYWSVAREAAAAMESAGVNTEGMR